jgi:S1-C subfamily serine protease
MRQLSLLVVALFLVSCTVTFGPPDATPTPESTASSDTSQQPNAEQSQDADRSTSDVAKSIVLIGSMDSSYISDKRGIFGSGTIINSKGFILTAFHVIGDIETGELHNPEGLVEIYTNSSFSDAPEFKYYAQVVDGNRKSDLAVLRIVMLKSKETPDDCLDDSLSEISTSVTNVKVGDELKIIGFPKAGNATLTQTTAKVAGFLNYSGSEVSTDSKYRAIKLDQPLSEGVSGGAVLNQDNELIGIPIFGLGSESAGGLGYAAMFGNAEQLIADAKNNPVPGCNGASAVKLEYDPASWPDFYLEGVVFDSKSLDPIPDVRVTLLDENVTVGGVTLKDLQGNYGVNYSTEQGYFYLPMWNERNKTDFIMSFNLNGKVLLQERSNLLYDQYYDPEKNMYFIPLDMK